MGKKTIIIMSIIVVIIFSGIIYSYQLFSDVIYNGEYTINNINIYKDTPAWKLALAVKKQNNKTIEKIAKDKPELLNYQDPTYGATLLLWAVGMEKYKSAKALLKCGADPNIATTTEGVTPLFLAAGYSWIDNAAKKDPKYVKLLLQYGADPNKNYIGGYENNNITEPGLSPLMESIGCGIEKTKALVEAGADIDYRTKSGNTVAIKALLRGGPNATLGGMMYAHYLIAEKKAKVNEPYYIREIYGDDDPNEQFFPAVILRNWVYDLDSEEHKMKMEIVDEFTRQGVNYWDTEIYERILDQIKKLYPDTWEEYIKRY